VHFLRLRYPGTVYRWGAGVENLPDGIVARWTYDTDRPIPEFGGSDG
jgi:hypothetical protein